MIDALILAPYYWTLKIRNSLYDKGVKKSTQAEVPTICVGNVTVGGTGKTPHTEMILRTLLSDEQYRDKNIAVLSRGYKRSSKGFQNVTVTGSASFYGDEPLQIKKKFPGVTVAVCNDRVKGCNILRHPDLLEGKLGKKCLDKNFPEADIIILDDAFQYRKLRPSASIVLVDYNMPVFSDHLLPLGKLRDLPFRIHSADSIIVSKCPRYMEDWEKEQWAQNLGIKDFNIETCTGINPEGKEMHLFFTTIDYCPMEPVFVESESRYLYSKRLVLFSGIANDTPLVRYLSDNYKVIRHFIFPDHHKFTTSDIREINGAAISNPTAVIATTDKDSHRIRDVKKIPENLKQRMFRVPIKAVFSTENESAVFKDVLSSYLR